jgi:hypothetical protein
MDGSLSMRKKKGGNSPSTPSPLSKRSKQHLKKASKSKSSLKRPTPLKKSNMDVNEGKTHFIIEIENADLHTDSTSLDLHMTEQSAYSENSAYDVES